MEKNKGGSTSRASIYLDKKYMLMKQIGEGGFGGIFLAKDISQHKY